MHRVEGHKVGHLVALQSLRVLHAADHGKVDGVLILGARGERCPENHLIAGDVVYGERIAQGQLVLGQRAGLVRAQDVNAGQFFDRRQAW